MRKAAKIHHYAVKLQTIPIELKNNEMCISWVTLEGISNH